MEKRKQSEDGGCAIADVWFHAGVHVTGRGGGGREYISSR